MSQRDFNGDASVCPQQFITTLVTGLSKGLAYIHSIGISHGDLYGHNILVRHGSGRPTLMDFGAAFFYDRESELGEILEKVCSAMSLRVTSGTQKLAPPENKLLVLLM